MITMKRTNILYWIFTGLLVPTLGIGSVSEIMGDPKSAEIITALHYPAYLSPFLGVARLLALIAIFIPGFPRLKEWAYAGLVFDVTGAVYSQIAIGNPVFHIIFPAVLLIAIFISYYLHHKRLSTKS
jgi:hypothetical protein